MNELLPMQISNFCFRYFRLANENFVTYTPYKYQRTDRIPASIGAIKDPVGPHLPAVSPENN